MTATSETAPLEPVTVDCGGCGSQFLSRARRHVTVRCPRCGHGCRVLRAALAAAEVPSPMPVAARDGGGPPAPSLVAQLARMLPGPRIGAAPVRTYPGISPAPRALRPAAELAARRWQLGPAAPGCCQITELNPHGWPGSAPWPCAAPARGTFGGGRVCDLHLAALSTPLASQ